MAFEHTEQWRWEVTISFLGNTQSQTQHPTYNTVDHQLPSFLLTHNPAQLEITITSPKPSSSNDTSVSCRASKQGISYRQ